MENFGYDIDLDQPVIHTDPWFVFAEGGDEDSTSGYQPYNPKYSQMRAKRKAKKAKKIKK